MFCKNIFKRIYYLNSGSERKLSGLFASPTNPEKTKEYEVQKTVKVFRATVFGVRNDTMAKAPPGWNIDELKDMLSNLNDRFGNIPNSFKNLFHIIEIKIKAKQMNIKKIENTNKGFVLEFKDDNMMNVEKLIKFVEKNAAILKLMPGSKLFFKNVKIEDEEKVMSLKKFLQILSKQI